MTRLQKKCLIAVAGTHLLVIVAILCSGFIRPTPKMDNTAVLTMIPAISVDVAMGSGVPNPQPPPPTPPQPPTSQPQVQPPTPTPPTPEPPKPESFLTKIEKAITPDLTPVDKTPDEQPKPEPQKRHEIKVDLKPVVHKVSPNDTSAQDAKEAKRERDERRKAFAAAARAIKDNSSSPTVVEMPGSSSVSYANFGSILKSVYDAAWTDPQNVANDNQDVLISTTIAKDGHVIESHILTPSGDSEMDSSVQRALDRVTFVAPFPDGASEDQRTFKIHFNLNAKRMNE